MGMPNAPDPTSRDVPASVGADDILALIQTVQADASARAEKNAQLDAMTKQVNNNTADIKSFRTALYGDMDKVGVFGQISELRTKVLIMWAAVGGAAAIGFSSVLVAILALVLKN